MNKFTVGAVMGGIVAAVGTNYVMRNKQLKNKVIQGGREAIYKADEAMDKMENAME